MKIFKKIVQVLLLVTLTVATFSVCACKNENEIYEGKFTFDIVQKSNGFYYPTIDGYINTTQKPTEIYVTCNDCISKLDIKSCVFNGEYYVVKFRKEIIYGKLTKGNHKATVSCVFGKKERKLNYTTKLYSDDVYRNFLK